MKAKPWMLLGWLQRGKRLQLSDLWLWWVLVKVTWTCRQQLHSQSDFNQTTWTGHHLPIAVSSDLFHRWYFHDCWLHELHINKSFHDFHFPWFSIYLWLGKLILVTTIIFILDGDQGNCTARDTKETEIIERWKSLLFQIMNMKGFYGYWNLMSLC